MSSLQQRLGTPAPPPHLILALSQTAARPTTPLLSSVVAASSVAPAQEKSPAGPDGRPVTPSPRAEPSSAAPCIESPQTVISPVNMQLPAPGRRKTPGLASLGTPPGTPGERRRQLMRKSLLSLKPTRANALNVFGQIDVDRNSKITMSELEDVALLLGFTIGQTKTLFERYVLLFL